LVGPTIRLYYDTVVAIALMAVFAIVCGFVAAVITGGSPPNLTITGVAFLLAGAVWFFRLWRNSQVSGHPPA
jgi:protein-S-isoprenylcysteine O-methyltransferase Ste14